VDITVDQPTIAQPFQHKWPTGQDESYDSAWEATVRADGRAFAVRHGLGYRDAFGKRRRHSTTFIDGYPTVEASGTDDYDNSRELASFIKSPDARRVVNPADVPPDYRGLRIVRHSDVISGPRNSNALAFTLREDAIADWARIATARRLAAPSFPASRPTDRAAGGWEHFTRWAAKWYAWPEFEATERAYKIQIADKLREVKTQLEARDPKWLEALRHAFGPPNNLTSWQMHDSFLRWLERSGESIASVISTIWDQDDNDRLQHFLDHVPKEIVSGAGSRVSLGSFLQMAVNEADLPFYKPTAVQKAYLLAGYGQPAQGGSESERYSGYLEFIDTLIQEAADAGVTVRDRLDAQGLAWSVGSLAPPDAWSAEEQEEFTVWRDAILRDARDRAGDLGRLRQLLVELDATRSRLWLVAQGNNYAAERQAGILRSPKRAKDGRAVASWFSMTQVRPGDVILHYARGAFRAVGLARAVAEDVPGDQELGPAGGWLVHVEYHDLEPPVARDAIPRDMRGGDTAFTFEGGVQQGYLFKVGEKLAEFLIAEEQQKIATVTIEMTSSLARRAGGAHRGPYRRDTSNRPRWSARYRQILRSSKGGRVSREGGC